MSEALTQAYVQACGLFPVGCVCGDKESIRREIRSLLDAVKRRHPGVSDSIIAALGNVTPYMLCDPGLSKEGADAPLAFASALEG